MRGVRSFLVLVVVLAGLGAYIYFVESKKPEEAAARIGPKLFTVTADSISEVTVALAHGDTTTLKKVNGTWQITAPVQAPADQGTVTSLVDGLATVDELRTVAENPRDLAQFGLAAPRVVVRFAGAGGKPSGQLLIGDKTTTLGDVYAKVANTRKVLLVPGTFDTTFNKSTFDLRQKTVLVFDRDKVDQIEIQAGTSVTEVRRSGGEWTLVKPFALPADYGSVEGLVGRLQTAQMKGVVDEQGTDLKRFGLDKPQATVTVGLGSSRATLLFGNKLDAGLCYAMDATRPLVFTVEASLVDEVKKPAGDLRRKDLFAFRAFDATSVEITRGADIRAFEKTKRAGQDAAEVWRQTKPVAKDVDNAAFDTFLTKLANQRAQSFVDPGAKTKTGLDAPVMVVVVQSGEAKKQERVTFGRNGTDVYASVDGQPGAAKIDTTEFEDSLKALDGLK
jgi:hypothetical protein